MQRRSDGQSSKPPPEKLPSEKPPPPKSGQRKQINPGKPKIPMGTRCDWCARSRKRCDTETPCKNCKIRKLECIKRGRQTPKRAFVQERRNCDECTRARLACDDNYPCGTCVRRNKQCVRPAAWVPVDRGKGKELAEEDEEYEEDEDDAMEEDEDDDGQQMLPRAAILQGPCSRCLSRGRVCDFQPGQPCGPCAAEQVTAANCRSRHPCQRCHAEGFPCDLLSPCLACIAVGRSRDQCRIPNPQGYEVAEAQPPHLVAGHHGPPAPRVFVPSMIAPDFSILAPEIPDPRDLNYANVYPLDQASHQNGCLELRGLSQCNRTPHNACEHTGHAENFHKWNTCYTCNAEIRAGVEDIETQLLANRKLYFCGICAGQEFAAIESGHSQNGSNVDTCLCEGKMKHNWLCKNHRLELDETINQRVIRSRAYLTSPAGVTVCPRCFANEQEEASGVSSCGSCYEIIFDEPV